MRRALLAAVLAVSALSACAYDRPTPAERDFVRTQTCPTLCGNQGGSDR